MQPLANFALALLFGTIALTALNPMSQAIAQEAEMSSPSESNMNQQIDIQEVEIEVENEIEVELEPEQSIIYTPDSMESNDSD
ncbi:hypothetical protein BDGGKGIB_01627 [Nodularia sphaerocarpa UHCC 0038]|nr:hypothetical protein BDGGKGIB_01627 [Nodularia sphaerocarpa UHCC 0038]